MQSFSAIPSRHRNVTGGASQRGRWQSGKLTDSAASATAIATGQKAANGVISVANPVSTTYPTSGQEMTTLLERFSAVGKSTGLVTTSYMTDAENSTWTGLGGGTDSSGVPLDVLEYQDHGQHAPCYEDARQAPPETLPDGDGADRAP